MSSAGTFCANCGGVIPANALFCERCGAPSTSVRPAPPAVPPLPMVGVVGVPAQVSAGHRPPGGTGLAAGPDAGRRFAGFASVGRRFGALAMDGVIGVVVAALASALLFIGLSRWSAPGLPAGRESGSGWDDCCCAAYCWAAR